MRDKDLALSLGQFIECFPQGFQQDRSRIGRFRPRFVSGQGQIEPILLVQVAGVAGGFGKRLFPLFPKAIDDAIPRHAEQPGADLFDGFG